MGCKVSKFSPPSPITKVETKENILVPVNCDSPPPVPLPRIPQEDEESKEEFSPEVILDPYLLPSPKRSSVVSNSSTSGGTTLFQKLNKRKKTRRASTVATEKDQTELSRVVLGDSKVVLDVSQLMARLQAKEDTFQTTSFLPSPPGKYSPQFARRLKKSWSFEAFVAAPPAASLSRTTTTMASPPVPPPIVSLADLGLEEMDEVKSPVSPTTRIRRLGGEEGMLKRSSGGFPSLTSSNALPTVSIYTKDVKRLLELENGEDMEDQLYQFVSNRLFSKWTQPLLADFLYSLGNSADDEQHLSLAHDWTHPLTDYFVSTSHNTYLTGGQWVVYGGRVDLQMYHKAVRDHACRCVEIDLYDGEHGEPMVTHSSPSFSGGQCSFLDVCLLLSREAFVLTDMPLILNLENNLRTQSKRAAEILVFAFGARLVTVDDEELGWSRNKHSSVWQLQGRVLCRSKVKESHPAFQHLIFYRNSPFHPVGNKFYETSSIAEGKVAQKIRGVEDVLSVHKRVLNRVYPRSTAVLSQNYNPLPFWLLGFQLVALNFQTEGKEMDINRCMFLRSGGCGIVLKPYLFRRRLRKRKKSIPPSVNRPVSHRASFMRIVEDGLSDQQHQQQQQQQQQKLEKSVAEEDDDDEEDKNERHHHVGGVVFHARSDPGLTTPVGEGEVVSPSQDFIRQRILNDPVLKATTVEAVKDLESDEDYDDDDDDEEVEEDVQVKDIDFSSNSPSNVIPQLLVEKVPQMAEKDVLHNNIDIPSNTVPQLSSEKDIRVKNMDVTSNNTVLQPVAIALKVRSVPSPLDTRWGEEPGQEEEGKSTPTAASGLLKRLTSFRKVSLEEEASSSLGTLKRSPSFLKDELLLKRRNSFRKSESSLAEDEESPLLSGTSPSSLAASTTNNAFLKRVQSFKHSPKEDVAAERKQQRSRRSSTGAQLLEGMFHALQPSLGKKQLHPPTLEEEGGVQDEGTSDDEKESEEEEHTIPKEELSSLSMLSFSFKSLRCVTDSTLINPEELILELVVDGHHPLDQLEKRIPCRLGETELVSVLNDSLSALMTLRILEIREDGNATVDVLASRSFFAHCCSHGEDQEVILVGEHPQTKFQQVFVLVCDIKTTVLAPLFPLPPPLYCPSKLALIHCTLVSCRSELPNNKLVLSGLDPYVSIQVMGIPADTREIRTPHASDCRAHTSLQDLEASFLFPVVIPLAWSEMSFLCFSLRSTSSERFDPETSPGSRKRSLVKRMVSWTKSGGGNTSSSSILATAAAAVATVPISPPHVVVAAVVSSSFQPQQQQQPAQQHQMIGRKWLWADAIRSGYRSVPLYHEKSNLHVATLLCHFTLFYGRDETFRLAKQ